MIAIFVLKLVVSTAVVTWATWVVVDDYLNARRWRTLRDWSINDIAILAGLVALAVMAIWTRWP